MALSKYIILLVCLFTMSASAGNATEIPVPIHLGFHDKVIDDTQATVTLNATANGALSVAAAIDQYPDTNFTVLNPSPKTFDWTGDIWLAVAFDSLDFHAEIDLDLHPTTPAHQIYQPIGDLNFQFNFDIGSITIDFGVEFVGWLNTTTHANLSYSFDVIVPPGSVIFFPLPDMSGTSTIGFNQSQIIPGPLNSTTGDLEIDFEYAFRPNITVSADIIADLIQDITGSPAVSASLFADVPKLDIAVSQVSNVTATCDPAPANLPAAQVHNNLTSIKPSMSFDVDFDADFLGNSIVDAVLLNVSGPPMPTACLEFNAKKSVLAAPSKSSGERSFSSRLYASIAMFLVISVVMMFI